MFTFVYRTRQALARLFKASASESTPDMSLREWADLPPYHPICDRTPC